MIPTMEWSRQPSGRRNSILALACSLASLPAFAQTRILLDQPLRAVEYQLARLTNDDLARLERKPDDVRYRPVYMAILTRKGLTRAWRDEAITALSTMDKIGAPDVLMQALARVPDDDELTSGWLLARMLGEPIETLRSRREMFAKAIADAVPAHALAGAYGARLMIDGTPGAVWQSAMERGQVTALLGALPHLPAPPGNDAAMKVYGELFDAVAALAGESADATAQAAAVRSMLLMPAGALPAGRVQPLAQAILARVRETPAERRTDPAIRDLVELGGRLADRLPPEVGAPLRRELDALGVRVVRIATVAEEMRFDRQWFVVETGRPVEIVLTNPDAMPHNLVVGQPGSLTEIGAQGSSMPMPADLNAPNVKGFVPNLPSVLYATPLVTSGNQARLSFSAPKAPGEYIFVCTFPTHWMRMYGVMLVVPDLEAWRAKPMPPTDPMTRQPY
jgi:azurin